MARLSLRHWLNRMARSSRSGRRKTDQRYRHRSRLYIEVFEDRCVPSTVTNLTDHDPGSLRDAIVTTPAGGTVDFQPGLSGTITLTSGELVVSEDLTIAGPGADVITVSGNHASRVFLTPPGQSHLSISGLTIANGRSSDDGGGISFGGLQLTLIDCTVSGNEVISTSPFNVTGGGIISGGFQLTLIDCTVSGNEVTASASNYATGGGIEFEADSASGTLTITNSTISGNTVTGRQAAGGGINFQTGFGMTIINSTVSGNAAVGNLYNGSGGGLWFGSGSGEGTYAVIGNSTFTGNTASTGVQPGQGGGIGSDNQIITATNTIIAGNNASSSPDVAPFFHSRGHNLIGDGTGGSGYDPTDLVGMSANPIDPRLGPLQDNGGPTQTMALLPGSPTIDAGDNTDAPQWDQRGPGYPRIVNGIIDIGAFEVQQAVAPTVTCSVADSLLWPPNHRLVNVGLSVMVDPPDANLHLLVYANDQASTSDAADIGAGTLQLRAEREGNGNGRVYLIVATATNSGGTSFDVCTVAVPHDHSPRSIAAARQQAAAAEAYYREFQTAPPGFRLLGEGPGGGGAPSAGQSGRSVIPGDIFRLNPSTPLASRKQESLLGVVAATVPAEHLLSTWASLPVDGFFATSQKETSRFTVARSDQEGEANGSALDLVLKDERLAV